MWVITAEEGHKDDLMVNRMVVVATVEEVWEFAKKYLEGKSTKDGLAPMLVRADYVPTADEYPKKRSPTYVDVAFEQNGKWVLAEH